MHYIYQVMLLIAQTMNILRNESMKIKMQTLVGYTIIIKLRVATEIMLLTILVLGLTPSNLDCLQHNFLTTMIQLLHIEQNYISLLISYLPLSFLWSSLALSCSSVSSKIFLVLLLLTCNELFIFKFFCFAFYFIISFTSLLCHESCVCFFLKFLQYPATLFIFIQE